MHRIGAETGNHKGQTDEASQRNENKMAGNAKSTKTYEGGTCENKTASRNHGNTLTQRITKTQGGKRGNVKTRKRKHRNTKLRNKLKTTVLFIFLYALCLYLVFLMVFFSVWTAKCVTTKSKTDFRKRAIKCIVLLHARYSMWADY